MHKKFCDFPPVSQPDLPRGTFGELQQYFAAPLDAKIGLKVNQIDNRILRHLGWEPLSYRLWQMDILEYQRMYLINVASSKVVSDQKEYRL